MVFKPNQQNLTQFGGELFPDVIQAPIRIRMRVEATPDFIQNATDAGVGSEVFGHEITNYYGSTIQQFVGANRQQRSLGVVQQFSRNLNVPGLDMRYLSNTGDETLLMTAKPELAPIGVKLPSDVAPTGYYVLLQVFATDVLGTGHMHHTIVNFSQEMSNAKASIVYSRDDNIESGGTRFYEGVFLLKFPNAPKKLGVEAYTVTVSGALDYVPSPGAPSSNDYVCAGVISQGWIGPGWGDTDGIWRPMLSAVYNSSYVDAYFRSIGQPAPPSFYVNKDVEWVRPHGGVDDPTASNGWKLLFTGGAVTPCSGFTPPGGSSSPLSPLPLGLQLFAFVYPLKGHVVYSQDKYFPIRKQLADGSLTDGVDLWDLDCNASNIGSTLVDGTYPFALERRKYLTTSNIRKAAMTYPVSPLQSTTGAIIPYDCSGFRLYDDGTALATGTDIFNAGGNLWTDGIPAGPPPLLPADPILKEKMQPSGLLSGAAQLATLDGGEFRTFDSWT